VKKAAAPNPCETARNMLPACSLATSSGRNGTVRGHSSGGRTAWGRGPEAARSSSRIRRAGENGAALELDQLAALRPLAPAKLLPVASRAAAAGTAGGKARPSRRQWRCGRHWRRRAVCSQRRLFTGRRRQEQQLSRRRCCRWLQPCPCRGKRQQQFCGWARPHGRHCQTQGQPCSGRHGGRETLRQRLGRWSECGC